MTDDIRFTPEQLDSLEARLWALVQERSLVEMNAPLPYTALLEEILDCDAYTERLSAYASHLAAGSAETWAGDPLLAHLATCRRCQDLLAQLSAIQSPAPAPRARADTDLDITIFPHHLADDETTLRGALDARRPRLLAAGFMAQPAGWHYTLEHMVQAESGQPGMLLTLMNPEGSSVGVPVVLVLFGQILHGTTDDAGQVWFAPAVVSAAADPDVPLLNIHLRIAELALP